MRSALAILVLFLGTHSAAPQTKLSVHWEELTAEDFRAAIQQSQGTCLLPFGILEKHGPHMPLGTDLLDVRHAALTAAQQQNIATLVDQKGVGARPNPANGYGPGPGFGRGPGDRNVIGGSEAAAATYLGTTTADLETKQRAGQTLAQIANATAGKSRDGLLNALVADATTKIDAAQKAGTITADQATQLKTNLSTRLAQLVDNNGPFPGRRGR